MIPVALLSSVSLTALLTFGPPLAGYLVTAYFRSAWPALLIGLVAAVSLFLLVPLSPPDLAWILVGVIVGVGLRAGDARRSQLALALVILMLGCVAVEWVARHLARAPPRTSVRSDSNLSLIYEDALERPPGCWTLDQDTYPLWPEWERWGRAYGTGPRLLELGDSMTFGLGIAPEEAFPARLSALNPGVTYVNLGASATSTDVQYVDLLKQLGSAPPAAVVLNFFVGNDIDELDEEYPCANGGPMLEYRDGQPTPRFATASWRVTPAMAVAQLPPPFVLRVASRFSVAARWMEFSFALATRALSDRIRHVPPEEERWRHFELILRAMKDKLRERHIPFALVVIPSRRLLESKAPEQEHDWQVMGRATATARSLDLRVIEPWPMMRDLVRTAGIGALLLENDIHFNAEGSRRFAAWLLDAYGPEWRKLADR
jgi:lysophospholipase L1-like esterase